MTKLLVHNIKVAKGEMHGMLTNGEKVVGFYKVEPDETITLLDLVAYMKVDDLERTPRHLTYDLPPSEVDYEELEDVISMKLGNFPTTRAKNYPGLYNE